MKTHAIKAILFDLDETLWPLIPVLQSAEAALYAWLELNLPGVARQFSLAQLSELRSSLILSDARFTYDLWALRHATLHHACLVSGENAALVDQAMAVFSAARNAVTPFDDVLPGLMQLQNEFMLGSISNGFADLQAIGIAHHFQISLAAHQFGCAKPDPRIFHAACTALQIEPHQALYVGDDPLQDIEGAQNAGMRAIWMNRFQRELPPHIVPSATVTNLHELQQALQQYRQT